MFYKKMVSGWSLVLLAASVTFSASNVYAQSACQNLVWSDEFNGNSLDTSAWQAQLGDGCDQPSGCGWGNGEKQYYKAENATVADGVLTITAKSERVKATKYTSARLRTASMPSSGEWTHGRFEARMKLPTAQGTWPAFWMLPTNPDVGWPMSGELDILESAGAMQNMALGSIHYGEPWPNNSYTNKPIFSQPYKLTDDFHTYAMEWTPYEIRWFLDDIHFATKTPMDMEFTDWWTYENYRYHIILNVAVGGTIGGTIDPAHFPSKMLVDYVRVYDLGRPSITGPNIVNPSETVTYMVSSENGTGATYSWTTPDGSVVSGSGNMISVDFSQASSGNVAVAVNNSCGTFNLSMPVYVEPEMGVEVVLDDFNGNKTLSYNEQDGIFVVAGGTLTYTRNSNLVEDAFGGTTSSIPDAGPLMLGTKAFSITINNTDPALVGKEVWIELSNSLVARADNYPSGRHSKFKATISNDFGLQTLRFRVFERVVDGAAMDSEVDTVRVLFDAGNMSGGTYYIEDINIVGGAVATPTPTPTPTAEPTPSPTAEPTPTPAPEATATVVSNVTTGTRNGGQGTKYGTASVTITNNLGAPVAGASVSGQFGGNFAESVNGTTDVNGVAYFTTTSALKGTVTVSFCVSSVTNTALAFDSATSLGMCP